MPRPKGSRLKGPHLALALALISGPALAQNSGPSEWTGPKAWAYQQLVESVYEDQPGVRLLKPEALALALDSGDKAPIILDTRERGEFEVSHIRGARWVGYDTFDLQSLADVPKDAPIVVYCSIGYRSGDIAQRLEAGDYQDVANLYGGVFLWFNESRPVYRADEPVDEIHPYSWTWGRWLARGERVTSPPKETP